jgi:hypothetical protein
MLAPACAGEAGAGKTAFVLPFARSRAFVGFARYPQWHQTRKALSLSLGAGLTV